MSNPTARQIHPQNHRTNQKLTIENCIILCLDAGLSDQNYGIVRNRLQKYVHLIRHYTDPNQCFDFLTDIIDEKVFLIISGSLGEEIVPLLRDFHQIDSIYIYCGKKSTHEVWAANEKKVRGVYNKIEPIYDALRRDVRQCEDDLLSFRVFPSSSCEKTKQLFIYTQAMKEILISTNYPENMKANFAKICLSFYPDNANQSAIIKEFYQDYRPSTSIRWFTRESFLSSMLSKAFRVQDLEMLLTMRFFIRDLSEQIRQFHSKSNQTSRLTVYRGQGISREDFATLLDANNGFISFENFLLTTTDKNLSLEYARSAQRNHQLIGVLFQIEVDRSKAAVFTPLENLSYYPEARDDILFSVNTIFRIHNVQQIEQDIYKIHLRLTTAEEQDLNNIFELIRKEIEGNTGEEQWNSLMNKFHTPSEISPSDDV